MSDDLDAGDIDRLLAELRRRAPRRKDARDELADLIGYIEENCCRTDYPHYRELGLSIGSGTIESGIKNVVNQRMKGCGMRWAPHRADQLLHLRAAYLSDLGPGHQLWAA